MRAPRDGDHLDELRAADRVLTLEKSRAYEQEMSESMTKTTIGGTLLVMTEGPSRSLAVSARPL